MLTRRQKQKVVIKLSKNIQEYAAKKVIYVKQDAGNNAAQNEKYVKVISDCEWANLTRQLKYKAEIDGKNSLEIGRFFAPSSKSYHVGLNQVGTQRLAVRSWNCSNCKTKDDREVNSAIVIGDEGIGL